MLPDLTRDDLLPLIEDPRLLPALLPGWATAHPETLRLARASLSCWLRGLAGGHSRAAQLVLEALCKLTPAEVIERAGLGFDAANDLLAAVQEAVDHPIREIAPSPGVL